MRFINETNLEAGFTMGFERDGREAVIVAVKATYTIPEDYEPVALAEVQLPLVEADEFTGEPGLSAPLLETDYAQRKPYCDVLLNGSAYAPDSVPSKRVPVSLTVGDMSKSFVVTGERFWQKMLRGVVATEPLPFVRQSISYNNAFGGVDDSDPDNVETYVANPAGRGFLPRRRDFDFAPMACTEEHHRPIVHPTGKYRPMSFGPVGRSWTPRYKYAGTYDEAWLSTRAPFWPDDFDYRYFQCAPKDQQIPYPKGGERVILENLYPNRPYVQFRLPAKSMPILVIPKKGRYSELDAVIDTIVIAPDENRFTVTWRAVHPVRRDIFEIRSMIIDESIEEYEEFNTYGGHCQNC